MERGKGWRPTLLLIAMLAVPAARVAAQALVLNSPQAGSYTIPPAAPFSAVSELRVEMRIVGNGSSPPACSGPGTIWQFGGALEFDCFTATQWGWFDQAASAGLLLNTPGNSSPAVQDVTVRLQWDGGGMLGGGSGFRYAEMWNTQTGAALSTVQVDPRSSGATKNLSGPQKVGAPMNLTSIGVVWVRVYSTVVATGGTTPHNVAPAGSSVLIMDWESQANGNEVSGWCNCNLSFSPAPSYIDAPAYNPVVNIGLTGAPGWMNTWCQNYGASPCSGGFGGLAPGVIRQLDGTNSYGFCPSGGLTYSWVQVDGPTSLAFSNTGAPQPTTTFGVFSTFGQYDIQLTVSDCAGSSSQTVAFGVVPQNDVGIVDSYFADERFAFMFGPLIAWGSANSIWPQIDIQQAQLALYWSNQYPLGSAGPPTWNANLTGTVSCNDADPTLCTGVGTDFQNDFCAGGTTSDGSIMVIKTAQDGWRWGQVATCESATQVTFHAGIGAWPFGSAPFNYAKETAANLWCWQGGSDNCNYYDNVLALYNLYYRSGLSQFQATAESLASAWVNNPGFAIGYDGATYPGNLNMSPREIAFRGLAWWAYETGQPDGGAVWTFLRGLANQQHITTPVAAFYDVREQAYQLDIQASMAMLDPAGGSDWAANLDAAIAANWGPLQVTSGTGAGIWLDTYAGSQDVNATSITLTTGSNIVQVNGASGNFSLTYTAANPGELNVVGDYPGCCAVASSYTGGPNGTFTIDQPWPYGSGTQTLTAGQYQLNQVLAGTGVEPFIAGLDGNIMYHVWLATGNTTARGFPVAVAQFLENEGWRKSDNGLYYGRATNACEPQAYAETSPSNCTIATGAESPDCTLNPAPGCAAVIQSDRYLTGEAVGAFGGAYLLASGPMANSIRVMADTLVGAALGQYGGPYSDANYVRTNDRKHKTFGFFWGMGDSSAWPGARLLRRER